MATDVIKPPTTLDWRARRAGLWYVLLLFMAPLVDLYMPRLFMVSGDAAATAAAVTTAMLTFRIWIVGEVATNVVMLLVALSLYDLLSDVDRRQARLMMALVILGVTIAIVNLLVPGLAIGLLSGGAHLAAFTRPQIEGITFLFLRARLMGMQIATIFWGLWLLPFGLLVMRSRFLPRWLGVLLIVGGIAYLTLSVMQIVQPRYGGIALPLLMPFFAAGELSAIFWLLVKGVSSPRAAERS
jgi:hypothetical protein